MNILWILDWKVNDTVIDKLGKYGAAPKKDSLELWKRIVFNMSFKRWDWENVTSVWYEIYGDMRTW